MRKLTLDQSEWLWALNRGKYKEYYAKHYCHTIVEFSPYVGGSIVKDLLYSSDTLLSFAFKMFNQEFHLMVMSEFPDNKWGTNPALNREEISWLMLKSTTFNLSRDMLTEIIDGDWEKRWAELDLQFAEPNSEEAYYVELGVSDDEGFHSYGTPDKYPDLQSAKADFESSPLDKGEYIRVLDRDKKQILFRELN